MEKGFAQVSYFDAIMNYIVKANIMKLSKLLGFTDYPI